MADATYSPKVYRKSGGDVLVIASGGEKSLEDGASMTLGTGVTLSISGTNVLLTGLPTSDPSVAGALYTATNVVKVSAG